MRNHGVRRIVFSSSCATYGTPASLPIAEGASQSPLNPYGESKLAVEKMLSWYGRQHGYSYAGLRYFNAAGADPDGHLGECHDPEPHLIPNVIHAACGLADSVDVYGCDYDTPDGTAIRDYIHVTDLANAHIAALKYLASGGGSGFFNLGAGRGYSVGQVLTAVEKIARRELGRRLCPRRPGDPPVLIADASRAEAALHWRPHHSSLDYIVQTAWNWQTARKKAATASVPGQDRFATLG
jgi:UDP-glucose-4-epimerase GalE